MALEIVQRLMEHAAETPHAEAFREYDQDGRFRGALTYRALVIAVGNLARRFNKTSGASAVILLSYPNVMEFPVAFFAVLAAGGTVFPVHPLLTDEERIAAARRSGAVACIGTASAVTVLESAGLTSISCDDLLAETNNGDARESHDLLRKDVSGQACLLLHSSGTTGCPRIVMRSGRSLDAVARNVAESIGLRPNDRVLGIVPACHSYGVEHLLLGPVWAGSCVHLCRNVTAVSSSGSVGQPPVTHIPGVPALFEALAATADPARRNDSPLRSLRRVYSAGAALPESVAQATHNRLGMRIGQVYGMTEIGSVTYNDPEREDYDPMSVGLPMSGVRVRIVDPGTQRLEQPLASGTEGEVAVSSPSMLNGYLRDDTPVCEVPANLRDGFFLTGDLGKLDNRDRLTITGRLKLVIDVGGMKVNLQEVELALRQHRMVRDCVVVPVAVTATVARLKALVIPRNGASLDADELRSFLRPRLSAYKIPRSFEICPTLPRSATGKILRHRL